MGQIEERDKWVTELFKIIEVRVSPYLMKIGD